ncbi:MAG TPA: TrmH family RNA methyltransferase [Nannocystis sp.]
MSKFVTRQCTRADCRLRFPVAADSTLGDRCPHCGTETAVDLGYDSLDARVPAAGVAAGPAPTQVPGPAVSALLDNVRSLRNVGSMFRTADGAGLQHMHLGGFTPTPAHPQMAKTSLGAESTVPWTLHRDGAAAAAMLRSAGHRLWALEGGPDAEDFYGVTLSARTGPPIVLVLGHEVSGVDPRILACCEKVLRLPMLGSKGSLNVSVAFGIAVYGLRFARG